MYTNKYLKKLPLAKRLDPFFDPLAKRFDSRVHAWLVFSRTSIAPGHDARQVAHSIDFTRQWTTRVTATRVHATPQIAFYKLWMIYHYCFSFINTIITIIYQPAHNMDSRMAPLALAHSSCVSIGTDALRNTADMPPLVSSARSWPQPDTEHRIPATMRGRFADGDGGIAVAADVAVAATPYVVVGKHMGRTCSLNVMPAAVLASTRTSAMSFE